jgi:hypothetical protein
MRTWELTFTAIDLATYATLEAVFLGTAGAGPYHFLDPEQRNLMTANVASGGDASGDYSGFWFGTNVTGGPDTANNSTPGGRYSISLNEPTSITQYQDLLIASAFVPVVPGLSYSWGVDLWLSPGCPSHYTEVQWFDATSTQLTGASGYTDGSTIAPGASSRSTGSGAAPTGAAYAQLRVKAGAANTSGVTVQAYTDGWQFEQAAAPSAWVPGSGAPLVTVESLSKTTPLAGICDAQMTLVQVG